MTHSFTYFKTSSSVTCASHERIWQLAAVKLKNIFYTTYDREYILRMSSDGTIDFRTRGKNCPLRWET